MDQAERLRNIIKKQELPEMKKPVAKVITVTSGKGGVGKSSISVNLAIQLSRMGKRVVIFDADFGLANIEIMLGLHPKFNLADMMYRGKSLNDIIMYGPENVGFISGGSGIQELANLSREQVITLIQKLNELDDYADVIIVDTGAGISDTVLEFVAASEEVLLVATPEPTSITDAYALLKTLNKKASYRPEKTVVKMIANQVHGNRDAKELFEKLGLVVSKFLDIEVEYLGSVPYDHNMQKAIMKQSPISILDPLSNTARALNKIANQLEQNMEQEEEHYGIVKLFSSVIRMRFMKS
ncbi:MAG: MinD/ParA family protein [Eubacterium sp.]|nr:MinD/ParA family protein [Eubacterium sp.]MDD5994995.1 MinD/ParA family protein [Clostridiales bacterium]